MRTKDEIFLELKDVVREQLGIIRVDEKCKFSLETNFVYDLAVDSLDMCFITHGIEGKFNVDIDDKELGPRRELTVGCVVDLLYKKINKLE
jgi:acyl carrier protein